MNACTSLQRRFTVGPFKVTLTVALVAGQPVGIECEWGRLTGHAAYRKSIRRNISPGAMPHWPHWQQP